MSEQRKEETMRFMILAAVLCLGVGTTSVARAQQVPTSKPSAPTAKPTTTPERPVSKALPQNTRPDYRYRHRVHQKRQVRPTTARVGTAFFKTVRLEAVADGIAKVRLVSNAPAMQTVEARRRNVGVGYFRLAHGVSVAKLKKLIGRDIRAKVQTDQRGKLIMLDFTLPKAK